MASTGNKFCDAALYYVTKQLAIVAIEPGKKKPSFAHGLKDATTYKPDIIKWWQENPDDNVGIVTGKVSGNIGVIDIDYDDDDGKDGYEFLWKWEKEHGELPETWTVKTARGGMHMYYRFEGHVRPNSANEELAIDFRGEGGYVMAPPSVHPNGNEVAWENHPEDHDLAWADANVMAFIDAIRPQSEGERFELPKTIKKGQRDDVIFRYACSLQSKGYTDDQVFELCRQAAKERCTVPFPERDVDKCVKSALRYDKGERETDASQGAESDEDASDESSVRLILNGSGKPLQYIRNNILMLENDSALAGHFRYDVMGCNAMVTLPVPWDKGEGVRQLSDFDGQGFSAYCEMRYGLTGIERANQALDFVSHKTRYNPLGDLLESLEWDGTERCATMFTDCLGVEDTEYAREVMLLMLEGSIRRAINGGCKFDYMAVLVGKQGIGKSKFVSMLAMEPQWYLDNMSDFKGDDAIEKIRGKWQVEVAELAAFKRSKDAETIKGFITTTSDTYRRKYARRSEDMPRRCVFWGTTNDSGFLTDRTGNRRFLPIECGKVKPSVDMYADDAPYYFQQCWAEAMALHRGHGRALVLPQSVMQDAEREQDRFLEDDPRVGMVQRYLAGVTLDASRSDKRVCVPELCEFALKMEPSEYQGRRAVSNAIHAIMQNEVSGWVRSSKRHHFDRFGMQRCYEPSWFAEREQAYESAGNALTIEDAAVIDLETPIFKG